MKYIVHLVLLFTISLQSCGVLFYRKIDCNEHILKPELYWFQGNVPFNSYILVNEYTGEEKVFVIKDKWISHREMYLSDSGCDCHDVASQLLISNKDSIWTKADYKFIEKNDPQFVDAFTFKFENIKWIFNTDTSIVTESTQVIKNTEVATKTYTEKYDGNTYKLVVGKGVGIIYVRLADTIWKRKNIKIEPISPLGDYRFMYNSCK